MEAARLQRAVDADALACCRKPLISSFLQTGALPRRSARAPHATQSTAEQRRRPDGRRGDARNCRRRFVGERVSRGTGGARSAVVSFCLCKRAPCACALQSECACEAETHVLYLCCEPMLGPTTQARHGNFLNGLKSTVAGVVVTQCKTPRGRVKHGRVDAPVRGSSTRFDRSTRSSGGANNGLFLAVLATC